MIDTKFNKFRAAAAVLQRGRESLVESLAEEILEQSDDLLDSGYYFNEFLESQGTRLHFLSLLVAHLEQSAEELEEVRALEAAESAARKRTRKPRAPRSKPVAADKPPRGDSAREHEGRAQDEP